MSVNNQLNKLRSDVETLKKNDKIQTDEINSIKERNILDDLTKETFPCSGSWCFTHEKVADRNNVTLSQVRKVIDKHGLVRKNSKLS